MGKVAGGARAKAVRNTPRSTAVDGASNANYRQISNGPEAYSWAEKHFNANGWNPSQRGALQAYTGMAYMQINSNLRDGRNISPASIYGRYIQDMDDFFDTDAARVPENITVWRTAGMDIGAQVANAGVGAVIQDKGFVSTALTEREGDYRFKINVPKGSRGAGLATISNFSHENELLLPRGSKFRVTGVARDGEWGETTINLDYLG